MNKPAKKALIDYYKGSSMPEEQEAIEAYLAMEADTAYVELCLKEAMASLEDADLVLNPAQQDKAWAAFEGLRAKAGVVPIYKSNPWWAYAAAVTVFILAAALIFNVGKVARLRQTAVVYRRVEAGYGKIDRITLPDSSHLSLFPGTVIDIPNNFNASSRKVFLSGRAYLEVAHNKNKPFEVITAHLTTRVLGTSFEVNTGTEAGKASVMLRTGRICVSSRTQTLAVLHPGQKLTYHHATGRYMMEEVQANQLLGWVNGQLTFDQTNFKDICRQLEQWYHITIRVQNQQLLKKNITASFKGQSARHVLDILSATGGFKYKAANNIIHIY